jgi:large subunit ribosomal protein L23
MAFFGFRKEEKKIPEKIILPKEKKEAFDMKKKEKAPVKAAPKKVVKKTAVPVKKTVLKPRTILDVDSSAILIRPRITEKASLLAAERNAYTFFVNKRANKKEIAQAIEDQYKVRPIKVNIVKIPRKKIIIRRKEGFKSGGKKAVVYLREGDNIEFV